MTQLAGTIGLCYSRGFATGLIRLGTRSHWNHVVVATGRGTVVEALPGKVRETPEGHYAGNVAWLGHEPLSDPQRAASVAYVDSQVGTKYNWPAILIFGVRTFLPWLPHRKLDAWAQHRPNVICSELAVEARCAVGIQLFPTRLSATVSPADIGVLGDLNDW